MSARDIIAVGASAGGVEALSQLARGLPPALPATVFVVCHFPPGAVSALPEILSRQGPLLARAARDGEPTYPGHIYVAPPDFHLVAQDGVVRLSRAARENRFRPSIDPLFRSVARAYGPRVVALILSGAMMDGVAGLLAVRAAGGLAVVQDPADALCPYLPRSALELAGADHVVPGTELGALITRLVLAPPPRDEPMQKPSESNEPSDRAVTAAFTAQARGQRNGEVSVYTCPECGGSLWQDEQPRLLRFRCHVGHAYMADSLLQDKSVAIEAALWTAVRTFREKAVLTRQLANRASEEGNAEASGRFEEESRLSDRYAELIHQLLVKGTPDPLPATPGPPPAAE